MYSVNVPKSIRKKSSTVREQPPRMCKNISSKINCESAIGQHLITNPECAKTYTDDNFRIIGQARSSFHLGVLESVYIKTQNPVLCRQTEFVFSLKLFYGKPFVAKFNLCCNYGPEIETIFFFSFHFIQNSIHYTITTTQ